LRSYYAISRRFILEAKYIVCRVCVRGYCVCDHFDVAVFDERTDHSGLSLTVKMRTEPADCGGGSDVIMMSKSRQDVEAAFAIAQLSEQAPRRATDNHGSGGLTMTATHDLPRRFSHVRTAVMPHANSRVEKAAVKRKFDWLDDGISRRGKQARLEEVQRVIDAERNTLRRHRYMPRADDGELVGRFIRTCESGDLGRQLYDHEDSVRPATNVHGSGLVFTGSSEVERMVADSRWPVLSAAGSYLPASRRHRFAPHPQGHSDALHHQSVGATMPAAPKRYLLPEGHVPVGGSMCYEDKFQGRSTCEDGADKLRGRSSSLVSAYYSLGQSAAAAAASQLLLVKPSARSNPANQSLVPARPQRVDSCTLSKVRQGTFGVLSTLRQYCSQLRRHSEPTDVKHSADDVEAEIAMDLSVRKVRRGSSELASGWYHRTSRSAGSSPSTRLHDEVPCGRWQTAGTGGPRLNGLVNQSSFSLPSSPYYNPLRHQDVDEEPARSSNVVSDVLPDVVPDSRLPLKKRWLYQHQHHHHQQQQSELPDCDDQRICGDPESIGDNSNRHG